MLNAGRGKCRRRGKTRHGTGIQADPLDAGVPNLMMLFFDIDETLVDQRGAEAAAAREFLAVYSGELGHRYSLEQFCALWHALREKHAPAFFSGAIPVHEQRRRRVRELFARAGRSLSDRETDRCIEFYESHYRRGWRLFDDVRPDLAALKQFRCGVISNGSTIQQNRKLYQTGIAPFFDLVLVSEEIGAAKPQPEIFQAACARAGLAPRDCVYIGDRLDHDTLPSRGVGMRAYWLCRSKVHGATNVDVIASLAELPWRLPDRSAA
jgi:putative hydrolase of the HAD superfamily